MMQSQVDKNARWRSASADSIVWVSWGDSFIAFHRPSGKTHFLNASSHYLITELLREPADAASILRAFEIGDNDARQGEIQSLLEHLDELGLIDRI